MTCTNHFLSPKLFWGKNYNIYKNIFLYMKNFIRFFKVSKKKEKKKEMTSYLFLGFERKKRKVHIFTS